MGSIFEVTNYGNTYRVAHASWEGNAKVRVANNEREASDVALKEFSRSLGNQRRMEAGGQEYNTAQDNLAKTLGQKVYTDANIGIAEAQMQGSLAVQAAANGVGGSSIDMLNKTTALQANIQKQLSDDTSKSASIYGSRANAQIMDAAFASIDNTSYHGSFDYTTDLEPAKLHNKVGAYIGIAAAFFLGGPSGSEGAADITMGSLAARSGDTKAAKSYFQGAAVNAANAYKDWQSVQDDSGNAKTWFQGMRDQAKKAEDYRSQADGAAKAVKVDDYTMSDDGGDGSEGSGGSWFSSFV